MAVPYHLSTPRIRNVLRFVDIAFDVYPLGLLVMFFDPWTRRLGDLAAGTLVVVDAPQDARPWEAANPHTLWTPSFVES